MDSRETEVNGRKYRMMNSFVLVVDKPMEEKSKGGVFYPTQYVTGVDERIWRKGIVMAIGPGDLILGNRIPVEDIKVNDVVVYPRTVGTRVDELEGTERWVRIVDQSQIFFLEKG